MPGQQFPEGFSQQDTIIFMLGEIRTKLDKALQDRIDDKDDNEIRFGALEKDTSSLKTSRQYFLAAATVVAIVISSVWNWVLARG